MLQGLGPVRPCLAHVHSRVPSSLRRSLLTLAIETSCDDTCVAVVSKSPTAGVASPCRATLHFNGRITTKNTGKGGIYPPDALDSHQVHLSGLVETALRSLPHAGSDWPEQKRIHLQDGSRRHKPDLVSVTRGPGMSQNLAVGLNTAKGLASAWQVPMVGVHHMQAHALTPRLVQAVERDGSPTATAVAPTHVHTHLPAVDAPAVDFPFLTLLVSGGHTLLLHSRGLVEHEILAATKDTAIGDELDKCGRLILPPEYQQHTPDTAYARYLSAYAFDSVEEFAAWPIPRTRRDETQPRANEFGWRLATPMALTREMAFAFSGIASQVKHILHHRTGPDAPRAMGDAERKWLARSALGAAFEHLGSRTVMALERLQGEAVHITTLVVSGGVAANLFLRFYLRQLLGLRGFGHVGLVVPPVDLCTDNAAMIGWAGMEMFEAGYCSDLGCAPLKKWSMDGRSGDGGILGVGGWLLDEQHRRAP